MGLESCPQRRRGSEVVPHSPSWLIIYPIDTSQSVGLEKIHQGERAAILLAEKLNAELIILDDKAYN